MTIVNGCCSLSQLSVYISLSSPFFQQGIPFGSQWAQQKGGLFHVNVTSILFSFLVESKIYWESTASSVLDYIFVIYMWEREVEKEKNLRPLPNKIIVLSTIHDLCIYALAFFVGFNFFFFVWSCYETTGCRECRFYYYICCILHDRVCCCRVVCVRVVNGTALKTDKRETRTTKIFIKTSKNKK